MSGNDTTIKFRADIASLKKEFREASNIIRLANSEFKASSAQMDNWENDADGVSAKLTQLNTVLNAQKSQLKVLKEQYEKTVAQQGEASSGAQALLIKMNNQKAAVGNTEKQIRKYNGRLSELKSSTDEAEKASADFDTEVKNLDDSLEETVEEAGSLSEGFTVMKGVLADLASTAIKNVIQGFKDIGAAVKDAYLEYDEGIDNVIKATGATGEAADNLKESYKEVSKSVVADYGSLGDTLGEVNTRFGFTGESLEECTTQFMKFADITGSDAKTAVQLVSRAMGDAGIEAKDYSSLLDSLALAAQASGISVDSLTEYLTKYGAPMRALGMEAKDSIAIFSGWEKAGVNTEIAFSGMKNAIANWAKNGKDARVEFKQTLEDIAACPDIASATTQAIEIFGKKAGPDLADAIHGGRFEYEEFFNLLESSTGTVEATYEETQSGIDKVKLAFQNVRTEFADIVAGFIDEHKPEIESFIKAGMDGLKRLMDLFFQIGKRLDKFTGWLQSGGKSAELFKSSVIGLATAFTIYKVATTGVTKALTIGKKAVDAYRKAQALLNATNPVGWITIGVSAFAGLATAIESLPSPVDKMRESFSKLSDEEQALVDRSKELKESCDEWDESRRAALEDNKAEFDYYQRIAEELDTIVDKNGKIKEGYEDRAKVITGELSEALGIEIGITDGVIDKYSELQKEIEKTILIKEAQAALDAEQSFYMEAQKGIGDAQLALMNDQQALQDINSKIGNKKAALNALKYMTTKEYERAYGYNDGKDIADMKNELGDEIDGLIERQEQLQGSLRTSEETFYRYSKSIKNNNGLAAAIVSKDTDSIKRSLDDLYNGFVTCETGTKEMLQKQEDDIRTEYENMRNAVKEGNTVITQEDVDAQHIRLNRAIDENNKKTQEMKRGAEEAGDKYAEGITSKNETVSIAVKNMIESGYNSNDEFTRNTAKQLGEMFSQGFANGIEEAAFLAIAGATKMASSAMAAVREVTETQSPSRKTKELGGFFTEGYAIGIAEKAKEVINSARSMAQGALNEIRQGIDSSGLLTMGTTLKSSGVGGNAVSGSVVNNYNNNFNQINNSPKALSRIEIYRQSKNLLKLK